MSARFSRSELIWLSLVLAAALAVYLPSLGNAPVFDDALLTDGSLFEQYRSLRELRTRMFSYGSFVWVDALFGDGWWKQRLVNVLIHLGVVVALWAFYREILRHIAPSREAAAEGATPFHRAPALGLAIGFFAINPVAVYAVAYLVQRSILLATLFVVLGLWLFAVAVARRKWQPFALAVVCYLLAVLSKEHAILAPLAALPVYIVVGRPGKRRLAILAGASTALVAAAGFVLSLRYGEILGKPFDEYSRLYLLQLSKLSPDAAAHAYPLSVLNEAWLFFEYGVRWVIPYSEWMSISLRPPFPLAWTTFPQVLGIFGYVAILTGGFFAVIRYRDWRALVGLSLLLPALLFMTEFATVWVQDPFVLYRSYLWAIGIPGLIFCFAHDLPWRAVLAVGAVLAALFAWQAVDRILSLESAESAWSDAIVKLPKDARAVGRWFPYLNRGAEYVERKDYQGALRDFQASARLGDFGMGAFNTGAVLAAQGRHAEALAAFDVAERDGYNLYNLPFQRGLSLLAVGRTEQAYAQLRAAWEMNPPPHTQAIALLSLGRAAMQLGRGDEAIVYLDNLGILAPTQKEGRLLLAMALITRNQHERARLILDKLIEEGVKGPAFYGRALANYGLKRKAEALSDIETAMRLNPENPNLREWLAKIRAMP